jgi:hypothetical protein
VNVLQVPYWYSVADATFPLVRLEAHIEEHAIADDLAAEVGGACPDMRVARLHRVIALLQAGTAGG